MHSCVHLGGISLEPELQGTSPMTGNPNGFNRPSVDYQSFKVNKKTYQILLSLAIAIRAPLAMAGGRKLETLNGVNGRIQVAAPGFLEDRRQPVLTSASLRGACSPGIRALGGVFRTGSRTWCVGELGGPDPWAVGTEGPSAERPHKMK